MDASDGTTDWPGIEFQPEYLWFSEATLAPVHELNAHLLDLLARLARDAPKAEQPRLTVELSDMLRGLDGQSLHRAANCPISLVGVSVRNPDRWLAAVAQLDTVEATPPGTGFFPEALQRQLASMTLTTAWTMARGSLHAARIVFAMDPALTARIAGLSISALQRLIERAHSWVEPRWRDNPQAWRSILLMAQRGEQPRLPSLSLRLMQWQLADLEPATRDRREIRGVHR